MWGQVGDAIVSPEQGGHKKSDSFTECGHPQCPIDRFG